MSVSPPSAPSPAISADKPRAPQQSSRRFLTGALVASLVAHIIFFAAGSQFPATPPPPPDRLIEVTIVPATPKKLTLAAVPHPPHHHAPLKLRRVAPPKVIRVVRCIVPSASKPRAVKAPLPTQPVPPVKPPPATRLQTPAHDRPLLKTANPPQKNAEQSHASPPVPGLHAKTPRRFAKRLSDEESYPSHPIRGDTTNNSALPPANTSTTRHQDLELAQGSDAATGPTRNSSRATHLRHSGLTGGNHSDTQPFLPDKSPNSGDAPDNGTPSRNNSAAPIGTENGSAREHSSNADSADSGSTDNSGFNHSGLPTSQSVGDNGTRPPSSRTRGNDDAAGVTDDGQPSGRSGHRSGSRHYQRFTDNPFGDLALADKLAPEIKPAPTQFVKARLLDNSKPEYPPAARRLNEQGTVRLRVVISAEGTVQSVKLEQSSGYDDLDESAQQWAHSLKFEPAHSGGKAVASTRHMITPFTLRDRQLN